MFLLADESSLVEQLDGGLDPNTRIDDQPLVKYAMMIGATAAEWFDHDELRGSLHKRFVTIDDYIEALKRMVMLLLERGADVNAAAGPISIIAVATTLNDPVLLERCLASVASVNDINSSPFLLAAERGDLQSLRVFLTRDARINKRDFLHGTTPLMLAAQGEGRARMQNRLRVRLPSATSRLWHFSSKMAPISMLSPIRATPQSEMQSAVGTWVS